MNSSAPSTKNMGLNPTEAIGAYLLGVFLASGFLMYLAGEICDQIPTGRYWKRKKERSKRSTMGKEQRHQNSNRSRTWN